MASKKAIFHVKILVLHEHLNLRDPHAVVLATVDLSKAFNRVSHSMVIEDLFNMNVPAWLLLILISYLTKRTMILHYKGEASSPRDLPGTVDLLSRFQFVRQLVCLL